MKGHWYAETGLTGGGNCGHKHRTAATAERCLPRVPPSSGNTQNFSMARVRYAGPKRPCGCHGDPDCPACEGRGWVPA